jgi:hypothetical protein
VAPAESTSAAVAQTDARHVTEPYKGTSKNGRFGLEFGVQEDLGRVTAGLGASVGEVLGLGGRRFPVRASFGPRIPLQPLTPPLPS